METTMITPLKLAAGLAAGATLMLAAGCTTTGDTEYRSQSVDAAGASSAQVRLEMGAGRLTLDDGARSLLDADFAYNVEKWNPEVEYEVQNGRGELTVRQSSSSRLIPTGRMKNEWDVRLSDAVPTDLAVSLGAGESDLHLGDLNLTGARIEAGAGDTTVDLTGAWSRDTNIRIEGGAGRITVRLPRDTGVRVATDLGAGDVDRHGLTRRDDFYVNDAYGTAAVTLTVRLDHGVGKVNLEVE
jgi:hypothetical protein